MADVRPLPAPIEKEPDIGMRVAGFRACLYAVNDLDDVGWLNVHKRLAAERGEEMFADNALGVLLRSRLSPCLLV